MAASFPNPNSERVAILRLSAAAQKWVGGAEGDTTTRRDASRPYNITVSKMSFFFLQEFFLAEEQRRLEYFWKVTASIFLNNPKI